MKGPPLGSGGEDITWPDQVPPRGQRTSSTRDIKPKTSNLVPVWNKVIHQIHVRRNAKQTTFLLCLLLCAPTLISKPSRIYTSSLKTWNG